MIEFSHIKYGVLVAMIAILFGGSLGLSFGCCEDNIKGVLKGDAEKALAEVYGGDQVKHVAALITDRSQTGAGIASRLAGVIDTSLHTGAEESVVAFGVDRTRRE